MSYYKKILCTFSHIFFVGGGGKEVGRLPMGKLVEKIDRLALISKMSGDAGVWQVSKHIRKFRENGERKSREMGTVLRSSCLPLEARQVERRTLPCALDESCPLIRRILTTMCMFISIECDIPIHHCSFPVPTITQKLFV